MMRLLPSARAFRMAWRELRVARARFVFVILAVAVGVASLTGVRGFSRAFSRMLLRDARTLMAADLTVRVFAQPDPAQQATLADLDRRGVARTLITETVTMASSPQSFAPVLVSVKAVDPAVYPFYGEVVLNPAQPLARALDAASVAVSPETLARLNVPSGATLRIGGQDFRIAGVLVTEPDRMTGSLNVGPRILMSRAGLDRTGLITLGSRASQRFLFRLPASGRPNVDELRRLLKLRFPEATIADYRESHPIIKRGLERATTFLSLIGLVALVIGALGVASAIHSHLQQQLDSIAVMKCLGARSSQVIEIYALQTMILALIGGLAGAVLGTLVSAAFPSLIAEYFPLRVPLGWDPVPALEGVSIALLITLLFTIPPLAGIRAIRPVQIFRRDMQGAEWHARWRRWREVKPALASGAAILLATGAIAATITEGAWRDALRTGGVFSLALAVALALLSLAAAGLLRVLRSLLRRAPRLPAAMRHGAANLHRPGSQARAAVVSLGVGVMFTLAVYLVESALVRQMHASVPSGMANVFLIDIPAEQRDAVLATVRSVPGLQAHPEVTSTVAARIANINGTPVEQLGLAELGRRFMRTRSVTWLGAKPPEIEIVSGAWWTPASRAEVCANEESARILHLHVGSTIDWAVWNRRLTTRVACIMRAETTRMTARFEFIFSPGQLESFPSIGYAGVRMRPGAVANLEREIYQRFPTVTVVNVAEVMAIVESVVDRINLVVHFISAFTILAGAILLASSVAGTRFRRMREVVILKTIGATRARVARIFSVEFLLLGLAAGALGSVLANGFAWLALSRLFHVVYRFDPIATIVSVALTCLVASGAGWAASFRLLGQRPLAILRQE